MRIFYDIIYIYYYYADAVIDRNFDMESVVYLTSSRPAIGQVK